MSFGKQDAPDPPNYQPIADASTEAAQLYADLGQEQLDWYKDQYNQYWPYVQDYLTSQTESTNENRDRAQYYYDVYKSTYAPIETSFASTAQNYATPERANQRAGAAIADVNNQYEASRKTALSNLESYGIDPSETRYGALDLSSRIAQAAAGAAAGTQSYLNTEATGLALQGEAINTGRGYASNVSQAYDTATKAGSAGTSAGTNLYSAGASALGTPSSYFNSSNYAYGNASNALNYGYNNAATSTSINNQASASTWDNIGGLIGGGLGLGLRYL